MVSSMFLVLKYKKHQKPYDEIIPNEVKLTTLENSLRVSRSSNMLLALVVINNINSLSNGW